MRPANWPAICGNCFRSTAGRRTAAGSGGRDSARRPSGHQSGHCSMPSEKKAGRRCSEQGIVLKRTKVERQAGVGDRRRQFRRQPCGRSMSWSSVGAFATSLHGDMSARRAATFRLARGRYRVGADAESASMAGDQRLRLRAGILGAGRISPRHRPTRQAAVQPHLRQHLDVPTVSRPESERDQRTIGYLWYDFHYPITDDMPGRRLFGKETEFWNPDLPRGASYQEFAAAGQRLVKGIFAHARQRGMQCAMDAALTEFPPEFAPLLPKMPRRCISWAR